MASATHTAPDAEPESRGHRLSGQIPLDPVRDVVKLVEGGMEPAQVWPLVRTCGYYYLLSNAVLSAPSPGQKLEEGTKAFQQMQRALERFADGVSDAPRSAISVHDKLAGFINAAQGVICQPGWFLDPTRAGVIAADEEERDQLLALLRQPMAGQAKPQDPPTVPEPDDEGDEVLALRFLEIAGQASNDDPLEAAQWVAENLMAPFPGWKYDGPPPVRLPSEIRPGESFREMFVSPRCWELPAQEFLRLIQATRVGLHTVRMGGEDRATPEREPDRQWDWEEQDRRQARRLAGMTCFRFPGASETEIQEALNDAEQYRANLRVAEEVSRARQARLDHLEAKHRARVRIQWLVCRLMLAAITQLSLQA